jgi:hypothetical protein
MADGNVNIDLLFRNGLKDYEVLPPPEVWNNILPAVRKKQKPFVFLRAAALIAVLLSLSILGYRWSREIIIQMQNPELASNEESTQYRNNAGSPGTAVKSPAVKQRASKTKNMPAAQLYSAAIPVLDGPSISPEENFNPGNDLLKSGKLFDMQDYSAVIQKSIFQAVNTKNKVKDDLKEIPYKELKEKTNKWSITALASPTYYMGRDRSVSDVADKMGISEKSMVSYSGGVSFAYYLTKKLSIQSGLYYSSVGNQIDGISSFSGFSPYDFTKGDHNFEVFTTNGIIYTENSDVFLLDRSGDRVITKYNNDVFDPAKANLSYVNNTLYQNFSYLEMPVFLRYKLIDKIIDFNIIGGVSYNILVNNSVNAHVDGNNYYVGKTAGLNSILVSSSLGMGLEYSLTNKISLNLEPTFKYYLSPFNMMEGTKTHPYSFGIFSGLSFKF